jgi:CTP synthase
MRLGAQQTDLLPESKSHEWYGQATVSERHRHRYEFNNTFRSQFEAHGMLFAGTSKDNSLVEVIELPEHPWFVAVQYHPEFKSKPTEAHPLFSGFIQAAVRRSSRESFSETNAS